MPKINKTQFGSITIDNIRYKQVLIVGNNVIPRKEKELRKEFDTTHFISNDEKELLVSNNPEIVIIGTGTADALSTFPEFDSEITSNGIKLIKERTPKAIKIYNKLSKNHSVNALIHTTC